jgi:hypothetical protein
MLECSRTRAPRFRGAPCLLVASSVGLSACAGTEASESDGAARTVRASVRVIADDLTSGLTVTPLTPDLLADESGVYWYDALGFVFAQRRGSSEVLELRRGLGSAEGPRTQRVLGMAADSEFLYVGDAFLEAAGIDYFPVPEFQPPGRLVSIPKGGGAATVLLEFDDRTLTPIAAEADRIIVHVSGAEPGYFQVSKAHPELDRLPLRAPFYSSRASVSGEVYWSNDEYPPSLLRAGFDDAEPVFVADMESNDFAVGPGYALSLQERVSAPDYVVQQNFLLHDEATGSSRALPGMGEKISLERALDARHAYWFSFLGEGPTMLPVANPTLRLVRVDIEDGSLTQLDTPGFSLDSGAFLAGQDAENLYVRSSQRLVAIEKP